LVAYCTTTYLIITLGPIVAPSQKFVSQIDHENLKQPFWAIGNSGNGNRKWKMEMENENS